MNIEHCDCLSWFSRGAKAMSKTARGCRSQLRCESKQHPAILPWPSGLFRDILTGLYPSQIGRTYSAGQMAETSLRSADTRAEKSARKL
jgi:hypothetical protein